MYKSNNITYTVPSVTLSIAVTAVFRVFAVAFLLLLCALLVFFSMYQEQLGSPASSFGNVWISLG